MPAALVGLAAMALGCGADFDPGSRVTDVRILAVRADNPFAAPGEHVALDALVIDPRGRTLQIGWATCVDPPGTDVASCVATLAHGAPDIAVGPGLTHFETDVPTDALTRVPDAARTNAIVGVVTVACPGTIGIGADDPAQPFTCTANGAPLPLGQWVIDYKRIDVRAGDRNANPGIDHVTWDGAAWAEDQVPEVDACDTDGNRFDRCDAALSHHLAAVAVAGAGEQGVDETGTPFQEQVLVEYYAGEGIFENPVRIASDPETRWVARAAARGSEVPVWLVLRDDRGGVSWAQRKVRVR
jgi:hypothetical protein